MGTRARDDLVYAGQGQGEFAMEPTLKYVGYGGDYTPRRTPGNLCCLILPALACLLLTLGLLSWLFWPSAEECLVHQDNYKYHWSTEKMSRCCARGFIPCRSSPLLHPTAMPEGPVDPFNCADGVLNWQAGWSTQKKQWCCTQHGKGCGQDAEVPAAEYDCNAGFANWVKGWSEGKKTWCCSFGYKSCPTDAAAAGGGYGAGTEHGANVNGAPIAQIRDTPYQQAQSR